MASASSIAFLALFLGLPLLMVASLVWLGVRHLRDRRAQAAAVESGAWTVCPREDADLHAALADLQLAHGEVVAAWATGSVWVVDWAHGSGGPSPELRGSQRRRLLVGARPDTGPRGVVARRSGGLLEAAAEGMAQRLGAAPMEAPGWEWARVAGPDGGFLSAEQGAAMAPWVGSGEQLHLGRTHLALSMPEGPVAAVLDTAVARLGSVQTVLGG